MPWGSGSTPNNSLKELQGIRLLHSVHADDDGYSENGRLVLKGDQFEGSQTLEVRRERHILKSLWDQRPTWLRTVYSGNDGDHNLLETLANVATSLPFVIIGLQTPRKKLATRLYADSLVGVGVASTLYHTSRGGVRKYFRWADYAMIATSTLCLSSAIKTDRENPRALLLASAMMIPFQPMLVTTIHGAMLEATFAWKVLEDPRLRRAHALHTVSTLVGGALFVADDIFPNTPYVHAAWHVAAAVGVATLSSLLE